MRADQQTVAQHGHTAERHGTASPRNAKRRAGHDHQGGWLRWTPRANGPALDPPEQVITLIAEGPAGDCL
jgi:hypothetical protein